MCDCQMDWYRRWWAGDWQKIDTDHIKEISCLDPEDNTEHVMKNVDLKALFCEKAEVEFEEVSSAAVQGVAQTVIVTALIISYLWSL